MTESILRLVELDLRRFVGAEDSLGGDRHAFGREPGDGDLGVASCRLPAFTLLIFLERLVELAELRFERDGDHELPAGSVVRAGVFRHQPPPIVDRGRVLFLLEVHQAEG